MNGISMEKADRGHQAENAFREYKRKIHFGGWQQIERGVTGRKLLSFEIVDR